MTMLPPGISEVDELEIEWTRDERGATVTVSLGEVTIIVDTPYTSVEITPWLVAALPNAMEAAWAAIEQEDS